MKKIIELLKSERFIHISIVLFLVVLFHWNSYTMPLQRDEGEYAYGAMVLLDGGLPYQESFMLKPPMILYTYALGQLIDSNAIWPPRLLLSISIFFTALLLGYIAKKEYGKNAGLLAAYLSVPMLSLPYFFAFAANTEMFMVLPLVAAIALYIKYKDALSNFWPIFFIAFLGITSILYKQLTLLPVAFLFIICLWQVWKTTKNLGKVMRTVIYLTAGTLAPLIIFLGYFIYKDGGVSMWENIFVYPYHYTSWSYGTLENLSVVFGEFWTKWTMVCIAIVFYIFSKQKEKLLFLGLFIASLIMVYNSLIGRHYFVILIPAMVIMGAVGISTISTYLTQLTKWKYTFTTLSVFIILFMIGSVDEQFMKNPQEISYWVYGNADPYIDAIAAGQALSKHTNENDYVFIAGSEPEILFYANRKSSSRFVITYPLMLPTPFEEIYQYETIESLEKNPPKAIVLSKMNSSGLMSLSGHSNFTTYLDNLLRENYILAGGYVRNSDKNPADGTWKEMLTETELPRTSLLLFKKKISFHEI